MILISLWIGLTVRPGRTVVFECLANSPTFVKVIEDSTYSHRKKPPLSQLNLPADLLGEVPIVGRHDQGYTLLFIQPKKQILHPLTDSQIQRAGRLVR